MLHIEFINPKLMNIDDADDADDADDVDDKFCLSLCSLWAPKSDTVIPVVSLNKIVPAVDEEA